MKASIIGCGAVSVQHADALNRIGVEIAAVCDTVLERAQALKARFAPRAQVCADFKDAIAYADSVHVCTPHYLHRDMIVESLGAGKAVLTEKPMCLGTAERMDVQQAADKAGVPFGVCLQNRYLESSREAKRVTGIELPDYAFGSVVWSRDAKYYTESGWRGKKATEGGGVLTNQAIHTLDLLIWCMGMPHYVTATTANRHLSGVIEVEDTAELYLEYADGRAAQFYATTAASDNLPVRICFSGRKSVLLEADSVFVDGKKVDCFDRNALLAKDCWGKGHLALIDDFYRCIAENRRFAVDAFEGGLSVRVLEAVYASNGKRVKIV